MGYTKTSDPTHPKYTSTYPHLSIKMSSHHHPPKIYLHLPPPTYKMSKNYTSTQPHPPIKNIHPTPATRNIPPPTPTHLYQTHEKCLLTQNIAPFTPNHPEYTSNHPCQPIKKCPPNPIQPKYTSIHSHLS